MTSNQILRSVADGKREPAWTPSPVGAEVVRALERQIAELGGEWCGVIDGSGSLVARSHQTSEESGKEST